MLTFISYWRAAAIVLNDLGSSAFYAAGIAEQAIGKSAPWFILAVMLFSFAVRAVYVESCSMFVRGGVYRVVKEALGGTLAKISVSALMFDYILTGPISGVSAGQYIAGLINDTFATAEAHGWIPRALHNMFHGTPHVDVNWTSVIFALIVTIYFWWQNTKGIQESSEKALRVMQITTVMVVILLIWGLFTVIHRGAQLPPLPTPSNLHFSSDALGFLKGTKFAASLGLFGVLMAFGHSVLAMSGEESLAQVNREIAHSKVPNLIRAGLVIFVFTMLTTGLVGRRSDNRIDEGGLPSAAVRSTADHGVAMRNHPLHPYFARLCAQRGYTMAVVAVAHRLCRILFALLRDGAEFDLAKLAVEEGPFRRTSVQRYRLKRPAAKRA